MSDVHRSGVCGSTRLFDEVLVDRLDCFIWSDRGFRTHSTAGMFVHGLVRSRDLLDLVHGAEEMQPTVHVWGPDHDLGAETYVDGVWRNDLHAATILMSTTWDPAHAVAGWRFLWPAAGFDIIVRWTLAQQRAYEVSRSLVRRLAAAGE